MNDIAFKTIVLLCLGVLIGLIGCSAFWPSKPSSTVSVPPQSVLISNVYDLSWLLEEVPEGKTVLVGSGSYTVKDIEIGAGSKIVNAELHKT